MAEKKSLKEDCDISPPSDGHKNINEIDKDNKAKLSIIVVRVKKTRNSKSKMP